MYGVEYSAIENIYFDFFVLLEAESPDEQQEVAYTPDIETNTTHMLLSHILKEIILNDFVVE